MRLRHRPKNFIFHALVRPAHRAIGNSVVFLTVRIATLEFTRATPGKRALGLRVTAAGGEPLGAPRHVLRQASGALSWLTLNLGHLLAVIPPDHQALHDRIARARVLADRQARLPRWARAWLWLQAMAACVAVAAVAFMLRGAVDAALLRML